MPAYTLTHAEITLPEWPGLEIAFDRGSTGSSYSLTDDLRWNVTPCDDPDCTKPICAYKTERRAALRRDISAAVAQARADLFGQSQTDLDQIDDDALRLRMMQTDASARGIAWSEATNYPRSISLVLLPAIDGITL